MGKSRQPSNEAEAKHRVRLNLPWCACGNGMLVPDALTYTWQCDSCGAIVTHRGIVAGLGLTKDPVPDLTPGQVRAKLDELEAMEL